MTATTSRTATHRIPTDNIDPIIDAWTVDEVPHGPYGDPVPDGCIGFYMRREWGEEQIWNPVYAGDTSDLYARALLVCDEDGSWF